MTSKRDLVPSTGCHISSPQRGKKMVKRRAQTGLMLGLLHRHTHARTHANTHTNPRHPVNYGMLTWVFTLFGFILSIYVFIIVHHNQEKQYISIQKTQIEVQMSQMKTCTWHSTQCIRKTQMSIWHPNRYLNFEYYFFKRLLFCRY